MTVAWLTDTVTSDLDRALHYTLLWGLEGIEVRTVGTSEDRVPFVNEAKLRRRLDEHELPVVAVVPGLFEGPVADRAARLNEVMQLREVAQFCARIGCARIVVSAFLADEEAEPDMQGAASVLRRAGDAVANLGVRLAVLNEAGSAFPTGEALAQLLDATGHEAVGAGWHPAEALRAGENPRAGLEALRSYVQLVRVADGAPQDGGWEAAALGEGHVGWAQQLERLAQAGFDGPLSLEVQREPRPKEGLRAATALIQMRRAAQRAATSTLEREADE